LPNFKKVDTLIIHILTIIFIMSLQTALELIKESAANNATELDLTLFDLTFIPQEIQTIKFLTDLDLSHNEISIIENLEGLPLTKLSLCYNKIGKIDNLQGLPLTELNLSDNRIEKIENLEGLPLTELNLSSNRIKKIENLQGLPLTELNLSDNRIEKIENLQELPLIKLDLNMNMISRIENLEGQSLHFLDLNNSSISSIKTMKNCTIQTLDIRHNEVTKIKKFLSFAKQNNIQLLYGEEEFIDDDFTDDKVELEIAEIKNSLSPWLQNNIEIKYEGMKSDRIYIEGNPITDCPIEILEQGHTAIVDYFQTVLFFPLSQKKIFIKKGTKKRQKTKY
jgi:Leucine-rich repeat (LRR) protein